MPAQRITMIYIGEYPGIARWLGGVHLHGRDVAWRWDEGAETVAPVSGAHQ